MSTDSDRSACALALRERGYVVDEVATGAACVNHALTSVIDAAVIDTDMSDLDGFTVARRIRAEDKRRRVKLVATSPIPTSAEVSRTRSAGFDLLVMKPVQVAQLVIALETLRAMTVD